MAREYNAESIEVLSGLDPVKKRPGMYTETSRPNHLALEVIDNSIDEALAGHASTIAVELNKDGSLVRLREGRVAYTDNLVFENLNWHIYPGDRWRVRGPNGSGKTCLLNLITGDHPQCYVNDLSLFGFRRGEGETIWDVKRHIGYVSTSLHWDYRLSISVLKVILSGFYDSVGLYVKASDRQMKIAIEWLVLLGLKDRANDSFAALSYGEQRSLLIARAMVKHPALLLLDEPCLGLDEENRALVLSLIARICDAGTTALVYVSHHEEAKIAEIQNCLLYTSPSPRDATLSRIPSWA